MAYNGKVKAFKDSQQTYAADMTKYNSFQRHFYAHNIYNVITELESLDSQRAACSRSLLLTCATLGQSMAKQVEEASSSFAASAEKIDPDKDCMDILERNRTEYLHPVDLPFLNLEQCSPATLESHSALMNQMLGTSNVNTQKTSTATSGILSMFSKSRAMSVDSNPLRTAFIGGIGLNPVKLDDMSVIQVSERIRAVKVNLEKVKNDLAATKRLQTAYQQNSSLGNLEEANAGVAKLERQLFSVSDLLSKLEKHFDSLGGARALAQAQSSLEATNPYTDSATASSDSLSRQGTRRESSFNDSDSDVSGDAPAPLAADFEMPSKPTYVGVATAKYDYEGEGSDYLTARVGQTFFVVELDKDNSGWTPVVSEDGSQHGFVPTAYMDIQPYE
uniref:SH3 domain-containing protein n=1 Tax=Schistocephalus solidus TaxID=70667 RepID=A0A0X3PTP2_SCHSO